MAQNYLLANLAAADITNLMFCALAVIPAITVQPDEVVGNILCKFFVRFNVPLTATVTSVFTLTVLAVERYNADVKPLQMLKLTGETVRYAIAATWAVSVGLNVPILVHTGYKFKKAFCHQTYSKEAELTHITFYVVFVFIIPFIVITFCYSKIVRTLYNVSAVTPQSNIPDKEKLRQKKQLLKMSLTCYCYIRRLCFSSEYYSCSSLLSSCKPNCEGFWITAFLKLRCKPVHLFISQFKLSLCF